MSLEVFDTLNLMRVLQTQYAASRAKQHFVPAQGMCCVTTARVEAMDRARGRWAGVSRKAITACGGLDALTAPAGLPGLLHARSWPVSAAVRWSGVGARTPW